MTDTAVINTSCSTCAPIYWSQNDTEGTIRQVKAHNASYNTLNCSKPERKD